MTPTIWLIGMTALLVLTATPLLKSRNVPYEYPLWRNVAAGIGLMTLSPMFPSEAAPLWLGFAVVILVGLTPLIVDGLLDRPGGPVPTGSRGGTGGGAEMDFASMSAMTSASLAATTATSAAII